MIRLMFSHSRHINRALDAAWLRNEVITNNIANIDTPNFKASTVEFESILKKSMDSSSIPLKVTNNRHIPGQKSFENVKPVIRVNSDAAIRMDGNNVDIENEQANLAKNTIYYNTLIQKLNKEYDRLRLAITEGK